jgi:glycosyltransferase involved in cell wall biosynthesis
LVSIIVPCHNSAPWLAATLESALGQTHSALEVIVIDDGSQDESEAISRRFESRGVRVVSQPKRGASAARNHGLRLAQGKYLQFLDADDLLTPEKIAAQVELLERAGGRAIASCRWGRFTDDPARAAFVDEAVFRDFPPIEFLLLHTAKAGMIHPAAWLVPRLVAETAGPWDERLSLNDDGEYFARVVLASDRIDFSAHGASLYRSNLAGSLSRRRSPAALESMALSVELIASHLQRAEDSPPVRQALADYWQRLEFELYPDAPHLCRRAARRARDFGGSRLRPTAGRRERFAAVVLGWKLARRLSRLLR